MPGKKLNFIIIISDTLRRDFVSCYNTMKVNGNPVDTRNISEFAKKCTVFENAYSASFPTVPHRHDVMAGTFSATYEFHLSDQNLSGATSPGSEVLTLTLMGNVAPVPEPSTLALLGIGAVGLLVCGWQRRKARPAGHHICQ